MGVRSSAGRLSTAQDRLGDFVANGISNLEHRTLLPVNGHCSSDRLHQRRRETEKTKLQRRKVETPGVDKGAGEPRLLTRHERLTEQASAGGHHPIRTRLRGDSRNQ